MARGAAAIGKTLAEDGAHLDVLPTQEVTDLAPYRAVVAGSAIQRARWLPEALQFIRSNWEAIRAWAGDLKPLL